MLTAILIIPALAAAITVVSRRFAGWITLAASLLVLAMAIVAALATRQGATLQALGGGLSLDALAGLYLLLIAFVGVTAALFSIGYLQAGATAHGARNTHYRAYWPLFNLFLLSMLAVPLLADLAMIWIAIELTTIFSAFLVASANSSEALEAAWKYVALTSVGAMMALTGVLLLYYGINRAGEPASWSGLTAAAPHVQPAILLTSFMLWLVGFGTKAGLVPLHTWLPDAHSQAPAPICALLSGVETSGALYMLLRLHPALVRSPGIADANVWYLAAGLLSVAAATFLLLQVHDFKRLFAYSTIEHMGVLLTACGLAAGTSQLGTVYQFFAHAFTKSFSFYAAGLATIVFGTQEIAAVRGLIQRAPMAGWGLLLAGLAIAGAPPFALFIGEFKIISTGFAAKEYLATGLLTTLLALAFIVIVYQLGRIVFGPADNHTTTRLPVTSLAALVLAFLPVLVFGFYLPSPLGALIRRAALILGGAS